MAKTPITTFSHNSLEPYTGTSQKFLDARLAGRIKPLVDQLEGSIDIGLSLGGSVCSINNLPEGKPVIAAAVVEGVVSTGGNANSVTGLLLNILTQINNFFGLEDNQLVIMVADYSGNNYRLINASGEELIGEELIYLDKPIAGLPFVVWGSNIDGNNGLIPVMGELHEMQHCQIYVNGGVSPYRPYAKTAQYTGDDLWYTLVPWYVNMTMAHRLKEETGAPFTVKDSYFSVIGDAEIPVSGWLGVPYVALEGFSSLDAGGVTSFINENLEVLIDVNSIQGVIINTFSVGNTIGLIPPTPTLGGLGQSDATIRVGVQDGKLKIIQNSDYLYTLKVYSAYV